jgi:hypothetical protein
MTRRVVLLTTLLALARAARAQPSPPPAEGRPLNLPFDCHGLEVATPPHDCRSVDPAVVAVVGVRGWLAGSLACEEDASDARLTVEQIFHNLDAVDPARLSVIERVVAQSTVLLLSIRALRIGESWAGFLHAPVRRCRRSHLRLAAAGSRLVRKLALPAAELARLGEWPSPPVEDLIGAAKGWVEKQTRTPLMHDERVAFTRLFHPVRSGEIRAIFSQVVAIDSDGRPHLTPIVEDLELRRGLRSRSPACALVLDASRLGCPPAARLRPVVLERQENPDAFSIWPGTVACNSCHGPGLDVADLPAAEGERALIARRKEAWARLLVSLGTLAPASLTATGPAH